MESELSRKSSVEQLSPYIYYNKRWEQGRWGPGRAMVYIANGWILLVPRGGRWQEAVVVVVVVAGRRHLVVVVVAASLLQSTASSAGSRHLVCLSIYPVLLATTTAADALMSRGKAANYVKLRWCRVLDSAWRRARVVGRRVEETWGFTFNFTHKSF